MKNVIMTAVILLLGAMAFYLYKQNGELKNDVKSLSDHMVSAHSNQDSLQIVIDSLTQISYNAVRYEIALERLKEKDPKAYALFEECTKNIE